MSKTKSGSPAHPSDADAVRTVDGDTHYEGSDMDQAAADAEQSHGHQPKTTDRRLPPPPPKPKPKP